MNATNEPLLRRAVIDQRGQVLPWVAFMMMLFLGISAFVIDVGHGYVCYRQLQAATDAAALAGAKQVYESGSLVTAAAYAATSGGQNTNSSLQNVQILSAKTECLTTVVSWGILCEGPNTANAVQIIEQATIPTFFAQAFGIGHLTLNATATAAKGQAVPLDVALVIDTTLSMDTYDSNCGNTELGCSMAGAQTLLAGLAPSIDAVSVFTFPNISPSTQQNDQSCSPPQSLNPSFNSPPVAGLATSLPYTFPSAPGSASTGYAPPAGTATYQVTGFSTDYRSSNASTTPNSSSTLVNTIGAPAKGNQAAIGNCLAPPNEAGNFGTYLAGAIYAAQYALAAEKLTQEAYFASNSPNTPTPVNIMIVLSDGNPNASMQYSGVGNQFFTSGYNESGVYPSDVGDCGQAVTAAQYAKNQGTQIFSIAYGAMTTGSFLGNSNINGSGCPTDNDAFFSTEHLGSNKSSYPNISPCQTMEDIASPDTALVQYFYSDYNQSGSYSTCYPSNTASPAALTDIFASIVGNLSKARLIPDNTQ